MAASLLLCARRGVAARDELEVLVGRRAPAQQHVVRGLGEVLHARAPHRVVVDASAESTLRLFTPAAPLCVGGAPAALEPLAAAYDGLARDAAAAGLLPPRAPNRWDAPLALAPGAPRRRPTQRIKLDSLAALHSS